jgi:predicted outer membrane repeat protein
VSGSTFKGNTATTVSGNSLSGDGGAIDSADASGLGTLTVSSSTFTDNSALGDHGEGGAIDSASHSGTGTLTVTGSTFSGDSAGHDGGAIDNGQDGASTLTVTDATFSNDSASHSGGAIANGAGEPAQQSTAVVRDATFTDDTAGQEGAGGAIDNGGNGLGSLVVSGSTFSGDQATGTDGSGGAIANGTNTGIGTLTVTTSTFVDDAAPGSDGTGGAIASTTASSGTTTFVAASTFTGDSAGADGDVIAAGSQTTTTVAADVFAGSCDQAGTWTDDGYGVGTTSSCFATPVPSTDRVDSALASQLGALASNGGPTQTIALEPGNPAIGLIPDSTPPVTVSEADGTPLTLCPTTDQRGVQSTSGQPCDAGAVQLVASSAPPSSSSPAPSPSTTPPSAPAGAVDASSASSSTESGTASATSTGITVTATGIGGITVSQYTSDPVAPATFAASGAYFDIRVSSGNSFTSIAVDDCTLSGGTTISWFDPSAGTSGAWQPVSGQSTTAGPPPCVTFTITTTSSPSLSQLTGTVFGVGTAPTVTAIDPTSGPASGGTTVTVSGTDLTGATAVDFGTEAAQRFTVVSPDQITALSPAGSGTVDVTVTTASGTSPVTSADQFTYTPTVVKAAVSTQGYWEVTSGGDVYSFGDAAFYGSAGDIHLDQPIVGMVATPNGGGYWLVAKDGGIFAYGDASFDGSLPGLPTTDQPGLPVVGMAAS